ncbi:HepT-like ribonuclease domain-containing protein [Dactylococcopsis salina]
MRNAIVHEYFQVDVELIWETIQTDLPTLKIALQRILISLESEPS